MRLIYSALWWLGLPFVLLRLWHRGRKEPGYRQHVGERLGCYRQFRQHPLPLLWVHAVSVGETRAAQPLLEALLTSYPHHTVLLTHMTATGRATGRQLFAHHGERVLQSFFPYDTAWMCARFLRHFKPQISILMETEVWPNMVRQCRRHHVPVMLVNARLSERSLRRGQRHFGVILREAAASIDCVAAQSDADAERLRLFGASQVHVTGSIKFDVQAPAGMIAIGEKWRVTFGGRSVLLCASTREGEEKLILDALAQVDHSAFLTVIVPRHPQRFDTVASLIRQHGFAMQRRSTMQQENLARDVQVILGDSMGEMFAYYAACDLAFIGGSLLPLGGQNLIEACALGKPALIGAHTFNFRAISDDAIASGAARRVQSAGEMLECAAQLLQNDTERAAMSARARAFARKYQGATARTMMLIKPLIR